ncbi:hypothetical protein ColTof4_07018 [Colletotrichum tofieldiae]|nr:hypothetical protein ColTof4_07018 [Colletotrichum tofieldiae]
MQEQALMVRFTRFWEWLGELRHFGSSDSKLGGATVVTMSRRALGSDAVDDEDLRHRYATPIKNSAPSVLHRG